MAPVKGGDAQMKETMIIALVTIGALPVRPSHFPLAITDSPSRVLVKKTWGILTLG